MNDMFENAGWIIKERKQSNKFKFCKFKESCKDEACKSCPAKLEESQTRIRGLKTIWSPDERRAKGIINLLQTIELEGIMAVTGDGDWELLEFAVDSGATETVVPPDVLHCINLMQEAASNRGVEYEVANGEKIQNLEEEKFVGTSEEGTERSMTAPSL